MFQHTAARRRLLVQCRRYRFADEFQHTAARRRLRPAHFQRVSTSGGFNTQPPEGGCFIRVTPRRQCIGFNTQPPEGGCRWQVVASANDAVSTHSRPKAAAWTGSMATKEALFQHTAARRRLLRHTRLPAAFGLVSTHSRPKAAALHVDAPLRQTQFQHTAARRRLRLSGVAFRPRSPVSTHSRPKAAAQGFRHRGHVRRRFNTQPPEGGCKSR